MVIITASTYGLRVYLTSHHVIICRYIPTCHVAYDYRCLRCIKKIRKRFLHILTSRCRGTRVSEYVLPARHRENIPGEPRDFPEIVYKGLSIRASSAENRMMGTRWTRWARMYANRRVKTTAADAAQNERTIYYTKLFSTSVLYTIQERVRVAYRHAHSFVTIIYIVTGWV